jgi:hypothetical protein
MSYSAIIQHIIHVYIVYIELNKWFCEYTQRLFNVGLLACILINEAHLFEKHSGFWDVMDTIVWVAILSIQICLLSVTVPIMFEPLLFCRFGISTYETIRMWTSRPEISFDVCVFNSSRLLQELIKKYRKCEARLNSPELRRHHHIL